MRDVIEGDMCSGNLKKTFRNPQSQNQFLAIFLRNIRKISKNYVYELCLLNIQKIHYL